MEKRQRPFTAEKRLAEFVGASGGVTNAELLEAFHDLSDHVKEVAGRLSDSVEESKKEAPPPLPPPGPVLIPVSPSLLENVKRDVAALKAANPEEDKLALARHELETVTEATDKAANEIMNQSDGIQVVVNKIREEISAGNTDHLEAHCATLEAIATNLLMACEFQDLTGQRINKVSNTMLTLEDQIDGLFNILEINEGTGVGGLDSVTADDERPDTDLLHGPLDEGEGISQSDIDAMFD